MGSQRIRQDWVTSMFSFFTFSQTIDETSSIWGPINDLDKRSSESSGCEVGQIVENNESKQNFMRAMKERFKWLKKWTSILLGTILHMQVSWFKWTGNVRHVGWYIGKRSKRWETSGFQDHGCFAVLRFSLKHGIKQRSSQRGHFQINYGSGKP